MREGTKEFSRYFQKYYVVWFLGFSLKGFHTYLLYVVDKSWIRFYPKHVLTSYQHDLTFVLLQMKEQYPKPLTC